MAERKPTRAKAGSAKAAASSQVPVTVASDGYEGLDWELYARVRPNKRHTGATGAGLVEYTLWLEVIERRPESDRHDIGLPGQPVR